MGEVSGQLSSRYDNIIKDIGRHHLFQAGRNVSEPPLPDRKHSE
jgi:hypothetical protein